MNKEQDSLQCRYAKTLIRVLREHPMDGFPIDVETVGMGCKLKIRLNKKTVSTYKIRCTGINACSDFRPRPWWMFWQGAKRVL